jgi:2-dehydropantoate 2-reductase
MKIVVLGAGVQGTLYGVRLARRGHDVTFVARGIRAAELRGRGAAIHDAAIAAPILADDRVRPMPQAVERLDVARRPGS